MVFGDNVRARWAARALPRTPPTKRQRRKTERRRRRRQATRPHPPHTPPFHTPQHSTTKQDMHCRHNKVVCRQYPPPPPRAPAFLPHTNHHRYSTMTQPCHKDTPQTNNAVTADTLKGGTMQERTRRCKVPDSIRRRGTTTHPRHSMRPPRKLKGDANTQTEASTTAPALHSPRHPPRHATHHPTIAPPTTTTRGEWTEDTPPHKDHTDTHPHTPQGRATKQ